MKQNEVDRLARKLGEIYGLKLKTPVRLSSDGQAFSLEPDDVHPNESFQIDVRIGWRSLDLQFHPGKFAADLLEAMGDATPEKRKLFTAICSEMLRLRATLTFNINGTNQDITMPEDWPTNWRTFNFALRKAPIEVNTEDHTLTEELVENWVERFYSSIIAISPLEEAEIETEVTGLPEGAVAKVEVNRYERSRINRAVCLSLHGPRCKVCEMVFGKTYGPIGEGFIHVHHVTPVSQLGPGYIVDPLTDLIPVCPNCHAMLHRRNPPYTVDELKLIIETIQSTDD